MTSKLHSVYQNENFHQEITSISVSTWQLLQSIKDFALDECSECFAFSFNVSNYTTKYMHVRHKMWRAINFSHLQFSFGFGVYISQFSCWSEFKLHNKVQNIQKYENERDVEWSLLYYTSHSVVLLPVLMFEVCMWF